MTRRALVLGVILVVLGTAAAVWWFSDAEHRPSSKLRRGDSGLDEWCSSMAKSVGETAPFSSVEDLVEESLARGADPQASGPAFDPGTPQGLAAHRLYFDWFPPEEIESSANVVARVVTDAINGDPIETTTAEATEAAQVLDAFIGERCR